MLKTKNSQIKESHTKNTNPIRWVLVGLSIGTLLIVLLGIIILWRIKPVDEKMPEEDYGNILDDDPSDTYEYSPTKDIYQKYTQKSTK